MTTPVKITSFGTQWPIGTIINAADGSVYQMVGETEAIPYIKLPPQRRFYAGSKGKPNRRILYTNRHGTYHATKGWRL
jgi:hypothetical protein